MRINGQSQESLLKAREMSSRVRKRGSLQNFRVNLEDLLDRFEMKDQNLFAKTFLVRYLLHM